ncbi:hypothetical protein RQP46_006887 [Phenoliferia psychrophenolica]
MLSMAGERIRRAPLLGRTLFTSFFQTHPARACPSPFWTTPKLPYYWYSSLHRILLQWIAHELRTPLHGLSGQLDHVREEATPEEASKFAPLLHIADVCLESLRSILDDTLDFAKLTSDVELGVTLPLPTNDSVDLPIFMESVAKACWTRKLKLSSASASGDGDFERGPSDILDVVFSFAGRGEGWMAKVNAGELRRIISNVFSNAIAATHVGFVCLQLDAAPKPGPDGLTMISDSGIGMSPAFLEQVYTPFVQADPFAPGCGLGLSIVKDLVTRMHGTIQIDSVLDEGELPHSQDSETIANRF